MIANFVVFTCKEGQRDAFVDASLANSRGSITGPGCVATSILVDPDQNDLAYVFEVFVDQDAFQHHHAQPYYQEWLTATASMLAAPYELHQSTTFPGPQSFRALQQAVVAGS
jgi:quinol monooxygenase YgiN